MPLTFTGKGTPITSADFQGAVEGLGCDEVSLWALIAVETRGFGFLSDRRPQILFERHVFHERTVGQVMGFNAAPLGYPDVESMVASMVSGEGGQLQAVTSFITNDAQLLAAFRSRFSARRARSRLAGAADDRRERLTHALGRLTAPDRAAA